MEKKRKFRQFELALLLLLCHNLVLSWCLNDEGLALLKLKERVESDPFGALRSWRDEDGVLDACSWFGVQCSNGKVIALNLENLCLRGTLALEIVNLAHIKSIVLRNNSLSGVIPKGLGELKELEVLDIGYNNFSGPLPPDLGSNLSLSILLLDNNELLGSLSPEIYELGVISEAQVDENRLSYAARTSSCYKRFVIPNVHQMDTAIHRRMLQESSTRTPQESPPSLRNSSFNRNNPLTPTVTLFPQPSANTSSAPSLVEQNATSPSVNESIIPPVSDPSPSSSPLASPPSSSFSFPTNSSSRSSHKTAAIIGGAVGAGLVLILAVVGIYVFGTNKKAVRPWATGLSGQLQKAFVIGVPKLKRSELQAACEDFSNVIESSPIGTLYKGTLSSGVEIAVVSVDVASAKDWSKNLEVQFRSMVETLSKVNHKNFVNLLGFCGEEEPFTRMMIFEYAPNGTLFEHLHIKESEHLNWGKRLRIAMGIAYCLEHMHQLNPPRVHHNLNSSSIYLTEDSAAKIFDFTFSVEVIATEMEESPESNVYNFGVVLFEVVTGRLPYSVGDSSLENWASDFLVGDQPLEEMVDPTLDSFEEEKLERIGEVIKACAHPNPKQRPAMREVTARLREITSITPDGAMPKLSPLWWAELEILSADGS